MEATALQRQ
jgi:hypothetical protein